MGCSFAIIILQGGFIMKRPYIICHILSSLDGRINGPFRGTEAVRELRAGYGRVRTELDADAWLYGTATTKEFLQFRKPELEEAAEVPDGDYIADTDAELYYISVDAEGELGWESGIWKREGRPDAHVVEVLTEAAPAAYRAYLRRIGASYIICGEASLDCRAAAEKLFRCFGIKKVLICGGGMVNWSFLQAGIVDELNLFLAPVTDGSAGTASLFTKIPSLTEGEPVEFRLNRIEQIGDGGLYLNYRTYNREEA